MGKTISDIINSIKKSKEEVKDKGKNTIPSIYKREVKTDELPTITPSHNWTEALIHLDKMINMSPNEFNPQIRILKERFFEGERSDKLFEEMINFKL